jgi:acyclic terpene utilization AtuA family protein
MTDPGPHEGSPRTDGAAESSPRGDSTGARPVRIGNCSGFYGDRLTAAREMLDGGPIDVLCGDYLAELTMLILAKAQAKDPDAGYAKTFLTQMRDVLADCVARGVKVVANAGGLNPAGLATALSELGTGARVAYVEGDDLRGSLEAITPAVVGKPVSANAYLGAWGIAEALAAGADVVVTGRVTDASLVVGPAAWWHGWARDDWDPLAGAVAAGHVIECGPQATGGNYSFLDEITDRRYPGFPIAEVAADGSSVITKHPGTGGLVSVGTVTAQLLYEIAAPAYLGPDCTTHFDTAELADDGEHRVRISGVRGSPPPPTLKVALNDAGGYRNSMTLVLTGLDVEAKAAFAEELLFEVLGGRDRFADVDVRLLRFDHPDAPTNAEATAHLRVTVKDPDPRVVGRAFSNATMELALGGYAGFHTTTPPTPESAFGVYRPAAVPREAVTHAVVLPDGERRVVADPPDASQALSDASKASMLAPSDRKSTSSAAPTGPTTRAPLGRVVGARSGDKGGDANVGLWTRSDEAYAWLRGFLTVERARELLGPEAAELAIEIHELPNLRALNVVVHGILGDGVASSTRPDPQAKGLGEYLRSRVVEIPEELVARG